MVKPQNAPMTIDTPSAVRFETERFVMRPLTRADVTGRMVRWMHDEELLRYTELPVRPSVDAFIDFVNRFDNQSSMLLGLFTREDEKAIGLFQIHCDLRLRRGTTEVLIGDRNFWGKKVVVEIRTRVLDFLFDDLGLHRVYGLVHARNLPAVFNYRALGFTCEGVLRGHAMGAENEFADVYFFGLLQQEWRERRKN